MKRVVFIPLSDSRATEQATLSLQRAGFTVLSGFASGRGRRRQTGACNAANSLLHPCPIRDCHHFRVWLSAWLAENTDKFVLPINESVLHLTNTLPMVERVRSRIISPSGDAVEAALSKFHATRRASAAGVVVPNTQFIRKPGASEICLPGSSLSLPQLLKWDNAESPEGHYEKGGNRVVNSIEDLRACCAELKLLRCGILLQELVRGHGVGAFFIRHQGRILLRFAHRRLHEVPWTGGVSAYCESSDDAEVLEAGERLLEAIDYEGVAMVEFRKEPGKPPVFLEINGRLWGSLGLALAAGADFPRAMVECHLDGKTDVEQPDLSRRVRWHDPGLQMDYLRSLWTKAPGPIDGPPPRWRGSLRVLGCFLNPRVKSDWWQWNDPVGTLKRYARLWRRELAWLKAQVLRYLKPEAPHPLIGEAAERTRRWQADPRRAKQILFLCYGNICRSPYAEARWNSLRGEDVTLPVAGSTGFHDKIDRKTPARFQSAARHRGIDLVAHRSAKATAEQLSQADLIFAMDLRNLKDVERAFPAMLEKTLLLGCMCDPENPEIPDPYGQSMGAGGEAYRRIDAELERLRELVRRSE